MSNILFFLEDYNYFYTRESEKLFKTKEKYHSVLKKLIARKHYQADSMANAFIKLGHKASIIIPEANPLQLKWAQENSRYLYIKWLLQKPLRSYKSRIRKEFRASYNSIQFEVILAQVKEIKPDIIYVYSNIYLTESQVLILKRNCKKIILQWTCPIWEDYPQFPYHRFDMIVTASIQLRKYFTDKGINCIYIQQAFDEIILEELEINNKDKPGDLLFIGSFSLGHNYRFETLEFLLQNGIKITLFGTGKENIPKESLVYKSLNPPLYGKDMYNMYGKYKMAIHIHTTGNANDGIDWNKYAGAKRIFEITGVGTMLLASHQDNIKDLFQLDKEVITFKNKEELLVKVKNLLKDEVRINEIARNGQQRTLRDHTFKKRAEEILSHNII